MIAADFSSDCRMAPISASPRWSRPRWFRNSAVRRRSAQVMLGLTVATIVGVPLANCSARRSAGARFSWLRVGAGVDHGRAVRAVRAARPRPAGPTRCASSVRSETAAV